MAIAFIPKGADPKGSRAEWLGMSQADEVICKHFGAEVDDTKYYRGWFDSFVIFDWYRTEHLSADDFSVVFNNLDDMGKHVTGGRDLGQDHADFVMKMAEPIYKAGYCLVSLNIY